MLYYKLYQQDDLAQVTATSRREHKLFEFNFCNKEIFSWEYINYLHCLDENAARSSVVD